MVDMRKCFVWGALVMLITCVVLLAWYLHGAHMRALDEEAYRAAKMADSQIGWEVYLAECPEGLSQKEATKRLAELVAAERERIAKCKEVKQPGENLYWLRCPVGERWNGMACDGSRYKGVRIDVLNTCPRGYRLPTRQASFADKAGTSNPNACAVCETDHNRLFVLTSCRRSDLLAGQINWGD